MSRTAKVLATNVDFDLVLSSIYWSAKKENGESVVFFLAFFLKKIYNFFVQALLV